MRKSAKRIVKKEGSIPDKKNRKPRSFSLPSGFKRIVTPIILLIIVFLIYLPATQNGFVDWDDSDYVVNNEHIRSLDMKSLQWMLTSFYASNWHPLTWLSHAVDNALWGLDPSKHHLTSILFHALNTMLVFSLVSELVLRARRNTIYARKLETSYPSPFLVGLVAALFFGLHPIHVESVAWVSERKDLLCAFFVLSALISYLRFTSLSSGTKCTIGYFITMMLFVLALMSKPMAVTFPVILLLLDVYPLQRLKLRGGISWRVLFEKVPFAALSLVSSTLTMKAQTAAMASFEELDPLFRGFNAVRSLSFYLGKMIWPVSLSPFYAFPVHSRPDDMAYILSGTALICISAFCMWMWRKRQHLWMVCWLYYLVTLFPVIGLIQVGIQSAADRYMYLPSLSLLVLCGLGFSSLWTGISLQRKSGKPKGLYIIFIGLFFMILSALTVYQIRVWRDEETLWIYAIRTHPDTASVPQYNLGSYYEKKGEQEQALSHYKQAVKINPDFPPAWNNMGNIYGRMNLFDKAMEMYEMALRINPGFDMPHVNIGHIYLQQGMPDRAIPELDKAIEVNPANAEAHFHLGVAYTLMKRFDEAIPEFKNAVTRQKDYAEAYYNLGVVYSYKGMLDDAVTAYNNALRSDPENAKTYGKLGEAYLMKGMIREALGSLQKGVSLDPDNPNAYYHLSRAFYLNRDYRNAIQSADRATQLGYLVPEEYLQSLESYR
ncbi:MAG: tetratricopeptide repeat protein [Deltaproteobacteria bacterium]|nr:tetratricopeptide repeat protein [Deltaproteobacteria bacterium]PIW86193.1 MAG: hypothetical protein COZ95_00575 [Nitrospirae bacterium CG_4_8_14_3_um_filter_50_41]